VNFWNFKHGSHEFSICDADMLEGHSVQRIPTGYYSVSMSMSTVDFYSGSPHPPLMRYMQSVFSEEECLECRAETVTAARKIPENVWKCIPSPRASGVTSNPRPCSRKHHMGQLPGDVFCKVVVVPVAFLSAVYFRWHFFY